jgi:hypothetical protein
LRSGGKSARNDTACLLKFDDSFLSTMATGGAGTKF